MKPLMKPLMKRGKNLQPVLVMFFGLILGMVLLFTRNPLNRTADRIMIRDGNTGEEYNLSGEEMERLLRKFAETKTKVVGINYYNTTGYSYMVYFFYKDKGSSVVIKGDGYFESDLLRYKADRDIEKIIREFIKE